MHCMNSAHPGQRALSLARDARHGRPRHRAGADQAQGRLRLRRAVRRPWLDLPAPPGRRRPSPKEFGDKVEITDVENVPEGPGRRARHRPAGRRTATADLHHLVRLHEPDDQGRGAVPEREVRACHRLQEGADNVAIYNARFYEGRHVVGLIAGKMTKTNTIGYIASFPIPEVVMGINATYLARQQGQPRRQDEGGLGLDLVRSGQGRRRRQGADRPGRRRDDAAHRQPGRHQGRRRSARSWTRRPGVRHGAVRPRRAC